MTGRDGDKSEEGVGKDDKVAGSRAGKKDGDDGTYVGRTGSDDAIDVGESAAEARSQQRGQRPLSRFGRVAWVRSADVRRLQHHGRR
jgi:hypothetical protein